MSDDQPTAEIAILNELHSPEEELFIEEFTGEIADLPARVREVADEETLADLDQGEWITVVDGEVVASGFAHPFSVRVEF